MDLKAAVVVVCLCAFLITSTKGNYPDKGEIPEAFSSEDGYFYVVSYRGKEYISYSNDCLFLLKKMVLLEFLFKQGGNFKLRQVRANILQFHQIVDEMAICFSAVLHRPKL